VALDADELIAAAWKLAAAMAQQYSSTAQDMQRGKPTEIDALNGYVAQRGAELSVPTPVNRTLHALVKLREAVAAV
jgi:2-dehydropantoate 2-reductase